MIPRIKLATALLGALAIASDAPSAQFLKTIRGTIVYEDLDFDLKGLLPGVLLKPVRNCVVEVYQNGPLLPTVAFGETDENGDFEFDYLFVPTQSYGIRVTAHSLSRGIDVVGWSALLEPFLAGTPTVHDIGIHTIGIFDSPNGGGFKGSPWNILDELMASAQFTYETTPFVDGPQLVPTVNVLWPGSDGTSSASGLGSMVIGNDDGLDDTVIHHEFGHIVMNKWSQSDSPGGKHMLCEQDQNHALSWSEGFATFWGSNARKWQGKADPGIYVDTDGTLAIENATFSYRLEDATNASGFKSCSPGPFGWKSEYAVQCALWDITDEVGDNPGTPNTDDDLFDGTVQVQGLSPIHAFWEVFKALPSTAEGWVDARDHWDGWWHGGYLEEPEVVSAFVSAMDPWMEREFTVGAIIGEDHFATVPEALAAAPPGTVLRITAGTYPAVLVHDRRLRIELVGSLPAVLGP